MASNKGQKVSATPDTRQTTATITAPPTPRQLPLYRVILHNDDVNTFDHVVQSIVLLTTLNAEAALQKAIEAHKTGCALLLVTHRERAELYLEQFQSRSLTVSIEPAE